MSIQLYFGWEGAAAAVTNVNLLFKTSTYSVQFPKQEGEDFLFLKKQEQGTPSLTVKVDAIASLRIKATVSLQNGEIRRKEIRLHQRDYYEENATYRLVVQSEHAHLFIETTPQKLSAKLGQRIEGSKLAAKAPLLNFMHHTSLSFYEKLTTQAQNEKMEHLHSLLERFHPSMKRIEAHRTLNGFLTAYKWDTALEFARKESDPEIKEWLLRQFVTYFADIDLEYAETILNEVPPSPDKQDLIDKVQQLKKNVPSFKEIIEIYLACAVSKLNSAEMTLTFIKAVSQYTSGQLKLLKQKGDEFLKDNPIVVSIQSILDLAINEVKTAVIEQLLKKGEIAGAYARLKVLPAQEYGHVYEVFIKNCLNGGEVIYSGAALQRMIDSPEKEQLQEEWTGIMMQDVYI